MHENIVYPPHFTRIFGKICVHYGYSLDEVYEAKQLIKASPEEGIRSYMAVWEEIKPVDSGINERMRSVQKSQVA